MIYLDHAATTAVDRRVVEAMLPYFSELYGNPSSIYTLGQRSRSAIGKAREEVAAVLGARPSEVVFTGCGSEGINLALRGAYFAGQSKGNHIITSRVEHHAVLHTCQQLADHFGAEITYLPVDEHGLVDPQAVAAAITPRTILVSVMYANNEVGAIQPIAEIGRLAHERGVFMMTDAVQAGGQLPLNVEDLHVDFLSLSAHKFYGPKGAGVQFLRKGTHVLPTLTGGGQEGDRRSGTENVPYIVGLATALTLAYQDRAAQNERLAALRDRLIQGLLAAVPHAYLTGHPTQRLPNNASFCFDDVAADALLINLDMAGIAASMGSACTVGSLEPSHVLTAMGVPRQRAVGALRLSLGNENTAADIDHTLHVLPQIVARLRQPAVHV